MTKKKKASEEDERPAPVPKVGTSMKGLLSSVKLGAASAKASKAAAPPPKTPPRPPPKVPPQPIAPPPDASSTPARRPSDTLRGHDRTAFYDAMAGVRGLGARPNAPPPRASTLKLPTAPPGPPRGEADRDARARLAALVSGGVRFEVRHEDDWRAGVRHDAPRGTLDQLVDATPPADATLDLHGAREADVETRVSKFVRQLHRHGVRRLRIVHGKGLHSDAAGPVLGDAVIDALTKGAAAGWVLAFVSAPEAQGGSGALLVELTRG